MHSNQYQIMKYLSKKFNDFVYFTFVYINGLKKFLHFVIISI